jgi:hypothetical protein
MSAIFGGPAAAAPASTSPPSSAASGYAQTQPGTPAARMSEVDVAAVMDGLAKRSGEKLDWRHSIVDLMKLLRLDSSLAARKTLAQELKYSGDMKDSATMNIWLHKQVMIKLADNGGRVPAELRQ